MKHPVRAVCVVLAVSAAAIAAAAAIWLYPGKEISQESITTSLDQWTLEGSALNGAPFEENKRIYQDMDNGRIDTVYITVFPTDDGKGNTLTLDDIESIRTSDKAFDPILDAHFQLGGGEGRLDPPASADTPNATIKLRGSSSRRAKMKSYKVRLLDEDLDFYGQKVLNINKHVSDISKVSNKFCMDMMGAIGDMASFRTYFLHVYIRDASLPEEEQEYQYYGLFTEIEQPNKTYLRVRGLDTNGELYKAINFEFRLSPVLKDVDDPTYNQEAFETVLGIREGKDHSKMLKMLRDVNDVNQDFNDVFHRYFNEENYLTWLACNILLGNEDAISHNFLLYSPQDSLTWYFIPWDFDGTFRFGEYRSSFLVPESLKGIRRMSGVVLHRRYLLQPGNQDKLTTKIQELLRTEFTEERVASLLDSYKPAMEKSLQLYPDSELLDIPYPEYNSYLDQFYNQIQQNYQDYIRSNEYPLPFFVSEPERNLDGTLHFAWEPSYSPQGRLISYSIHLASDAGMQNLIISETGLQSPFFDTPGPIPDGVYYLAVTATDNEGNEQISLDLYSAPPPVTEAEKAEYIRNGRSRRYYGVRQFELE